MMYETRTPGLNPNVFDWNRDIGPYESPTDATNHAREAGQSFREYAEDYRVNWPFDDEPPDNLVDGMIAAMELAT